MSGRDLVRPALRSAGKLVEDELDYWRGELLGPWEGGRSGRPAEVGRWIGVGLAAAAALAGLIAALRAERPWE